LKPAPFDYFAPDTLDEALTLLQQYGSEAKVLAGGQSLVPLLALRLATPSVIVDINRVPDLDRVQRKDRTLTIGALARHRAVELATALREACEM
jgi:CO/xanthine dehydrogenase FAD-binding subunit